MFREMGFDETSLGVDTQNPNRRYHSLVRIHKKENAEYNQQDPFDFSFP